MTNAACEIEIGEVGGDSSDKKGQKKGTNADDRGEIVALAENIAKREKENKETLKRLVEAIGKGAQKKMKVQLKLQTAKSRYCALKKDNSKMEQGLKETMDGLGASGGRRGDKDRGGKDEDEGGKKETLYDEKGRLKKDQALPGKTEERMKDLKDTLQNERQRADEVRKQCDQTERQIEGLEKEDKDNKEKAEERRRKLKKTSDLGKSLVDEIRTWLADVQQLINENVNAKSNEAPIKEVIGEGEQLIGRLKVDVEASEILCNGLNDRCVKMQTAKGAADLTSKQCAISGVKLSQMRKKLYNDVEMECGKGDKNAQPPTFWPNSNNIAQDVANLYDFACGACRDSVPALEKMKALHIDVKTESEAQQNATHKELVALDNELNDLKAKLKKENAENEALQEEVDKRQFREYQKAKADQEKWALLLNETVDFVVSYEKLVQQVGNRPELNLPMDHGGDALQATVQKLTAKRDKLKGEMAKMDQKIDGANAKSAEKREQAEQKTRVLQDKLNSLEMRKRDIQAKFKDAEAKFVASKEKADQFEAADKACNALATEVKKKEDLLREKKERVSRLRNELETKEGEASYFKDRRAVLHNANEILSKRLQREIKTLKEINDEVDLETQVSERKAESVAPQRSAIPEQKFAEAMPVPIKREIPRVKQLGRDLSPFEKVQQLQTENDELNQEEIMLSKAASELRQRNKSRSKSRGRQRRSAKEEKVAERQPRERPAKSRKVMKKESSSLRSSSQKSAPSAPAQRQRRDKVEPLVIPRKSRRRELVPPPSPAVENPDVARENVVTPVKTKNAEAKVPDEPKVVSRGRDHRRFKAQKSAGSSRRKRSPPVAKPEKIERAKKLETHPREKVKDQDAPKQQKSKKREEPKESRKTKERSRSSDRSHSTEEDPKSADLDKELKVELQRSKVEQPEEFRTVAKKGYISGELQRPVPKRKVKSEEKSKTRQREKKKMGKLANKPWRSMSSSQSQEESVEVVDNRGQKKTKKVKRMEEMH